MTHPEPRNEADIYGQAAVDGEALVALDEQVLEGLNTKHNGDAEQMVFEALAIGREHGARMQKQNQEEADAMAFEFQPVDYLKALVDKLTDEQRVDLFSHYCHHCGTKQLPCHCMNDE